MIFALFALLAGSTPPDVNEAHYLGKAKHYWSPQWCQGDLFMESADAHAVFYWTFGWVTLFASLPATAWIGRIITWALLAWSWRRLSFAVAPLTGWSVVTAAGFVELSRRCHMAGEWVVGGVEAKGFAYALALLGLEALVRGRWARVWPLLGAAASFHVLVGGWSLVAAGAVWLSEGRHRPPLRQTLLAMGAGMLLAAPGLITALALTRGVDPETVRRANIIYVYVRLPHHLVFHHFDAAAVRQFALLTGAWIALIALLAWRRSLPRESQRLARFVAAALLIGLVGVLLDYGLRSNRALSAALLRYYWFRLPDAAVPLGMALAAGTAVWQLARWRKPAGMLTGAALLGLAAWAVVDDVRTSWHDPRSGADRQTLPTVRGYRAATLRIARDWHSACDWIAENAPPDARVLTPRTQQTFKWRTGRAETATWKDVPQDAAALMAWWRQFKDLHGTPIWEGGYTARSDAELRELADKYDFDLIIVERRFARRRLGFEHVYPARRNDNLYYDIFRVGRRHEHANSGS